MPVIRSRAAAWVVWWTSSRPSTRKKNKKKPHRTAERTAALLSSVRRRTHPTVPICRGEFAGRFGRSAGRREKFLRRKEPIGKRLRNSGTADARARSQGEPVVAIMEGDMSATGLDVFDKTLQTTHIFLTRSWP